MAVAFKEMSADEQSKVLLEYVHGRTPEALGKQIEAVAAHDVNLADELAYYRGLASALREDEAPASFDEVGWARLNKAIDEESRPVDHTPPMPANDNVRVWRYASVALALVVAVQGVFLSTGPAQFAGGGEGQYIPVSEASAKHTLQVVFAPTVTEQDIRTALMEARARIVDGPGALGIYTLEFASEADMQAALRQLSEKTTLIENIYED